MSDTREWKGQRIGPYRIGERYPGIPEDECRLHEAHHLETREPALAVIPPSGEDWRLPTPWCLRTTNFPEPGVLIVDAEPLHDSSAPTVHELTLGAIHTAGALSSLDAREEAPTLFARKSPARSRRQPLRWGLAAVGLLLVAGLVLWLRPGSGEPAETRLAHDTGMPSLPEDSISFGNARDFSFPVAIGYPMPEKPFKQQATPPCIPVTEVEIRGGCWILHTQSAPCPRSTAEYQGKCYIPSKKEEPQPRSVQP
ncbi:hypothetical protein [Melittangium boletus]|uniref:Protein kinase n=1 Tax=Melittangium boletus DSM 14713 TaxID=1294270 RepID=A0A250IRF5_9BACT|nr:hypothetical protein [Melittangium boletus]ATB33832.1 hypothetical protein MEBOL_007330 [Melittangium boletus DSM 14713]